MRKSHSSDGTHGQDRAGSTVQAARDGVLRLACIVKPGAFANHKGAGRGQAAGRIRAVYSDAGPLLPILIRLRLRVNGRAWVDSRGKLHLHVCAVLGWHDGHGAECLTNLPLNSTLLEQEYISFFCLSC